MPWTIVKDGEMFCIHKENEDKSPGEKVKCHNSEQEAKDHMAALYSNSDMAVKAIGDWELEIRAVPFGKDRDEQSFDARTDFMLDEFSTPVITYHHGVAPDRNGIQGNPVIIGKTTSIEKRHDGVWLRVVLDKTLDFARRVWDAAKKGLAVASSDSILHLARLEVSGRKIMYEKDRPGRIAVWPLAGVSLWDATGDNLRPASPHALAMPAMKAIYREAGIPFPAGTGDEAEANKALRTRTKQAQEKANQFIKRTNKYVQE